jgi:hypothetical protein
MMIILFLQSWERRPPQKKIHRRPFSIFGEASAKDYNSISINHKPPLVTIIITIIISFSNGEIHLIIL